MGKLSKHQKTALQNPQSRSISGPVPPPKASSTILHSSFCPTQLQSSLFASVTHDFDSEHLRIHDTRTERIQSDHALPSTTSVTCLDWGVLGRKRQPHTLSNGSKKRKRSGYASSANPEDVIIAFGTQSSGIHLFSPTKARVVASLTKGATDDICDFKFYNYGYTAEGWSVSRDSKLTQWSMETFTPMRSVEHQPGST